MAASDVTVPFETWDVYTPRAFAGTPLAIVRDETGMSSRDMRLMARGFPGETVFLQPSASGEGLARARIMDPQREITFSAHAAIGSAVAVASWGEVFGQEVGDTPTLEFQVGPVPCPVAQRDGRWQAGFVSRTPLERLAEIPPAAAAAALGLTESVVRCENHAPALVSKGLPCALIELASPDALSGVAPQEAALTAITASHAAASQACAIAAYHRPSPQRIDIRAFAPLPGAPELPATGSAAVALGALLAECEGAILSFSAAQGMTLGRPGTFAIEARPGRAGAWVRLSAPATQVMRGRITRPHTG